MTTPEKEPQWQTLLHSWKKRLDVLGDTSGRVFHGRSGGHGVLDTVTVDSYPPILVLATYGPLPQEILERLSGMLLQLGRERGWESRKEFAVLHQVREGPNVSWNALIGEIPSAYQAKYLGFNFEISLGEHQNTGLFFDMQNGHQHVSHLAHGCRVLNLFAYTCTFSLVAIQAGAAQVVNVDVSRSALARGRRNHLLNGLDPKRARFLPHNVMKSMGAFRRMGPFGLVIADPPSNQAGRFEARRDYPKLARQLPSLMAPEGNLMACLNAPYIEVEEMLAWFSPHHFQLQQRWGRPPIYGEQSSAEDLKILHLRYLPPSHSELR